MIDFSFLSLVMGFLGASGAVFCAFFEKMMFFFEFDVKKRFKMFDYNVFCYLCASLTL